MTQVWWLLLCHVSVTLQRGTGDDPPHVRIVGNVHLGFTGDVTFSTIESHNNRTVLCVLDTRAIQTGEFRMADVDATLCTHLMIRPVEMERGEGGNFVLVNRDLSERASNKMYKDAVDLKKENPKLKVILSIGGWDEGVADFQYISTYYNYLTSFGTNVVNFLKYKKLDGVNVEWMWPGVVNRGGKASDKDGMTELIDSLSEVLKAAKFELGVTLPASVPIIIEGFNLPALEGNVDYFILMGQDLAGEMGQIAGHHSPLLPVTRRTVGKTVKFVLDKKISPHKVILGIPFVGREFKLRDAQVDGSRLGAPTVKSDDKVVNYNEICKILRSPFSSWTVYEDTEAKVPFMRDGRRNWVSFDDTKSVQAKVEFGEERGLGGYAAWSIATDDFRGNLCDEGTKTKYPLLRTINYVLSKEGTKATISLEDTAPILNITEDTNSLNLNVTTNTTLPDVDFRDEVDGESEGVTAKEGGSDSSVVSYVNANVTLLGVILLLAAVIAVLLLVVWKRRGNDGALSKSEISRFKEGYAIVAGKEGEDYINCNPYDTCLEIPHTEYEICADEILGSGAYGIVMKGKVRNEVVAVKTVKPLSGKEYVLSLLEEIKVMTYLGKHENILGLIGANTVLLRRGIVYVFVEFCPLGSLENYLKVNKPSFVNLMKNDKFACETSPAKDNREGMSSATLLIWAHQISNAMQFLASKMVIHGDLATRNVLLRSKHVVKISDFGLSRKMYEYCNYIKQKQEPLPWRHMSLEALKSMEFSTKSDVWAFGVTLWEIFTLGDLPYPGMSYTLGFIDDLIGGLRMPKPKYATTELYLKAMRQTWNENPVDRPSFEELSAFLRESVERVSYEGYKSTIEWFHS